MKGENQHLLSQGNRFREAALSRGGVVMPDAIVRVSGSQVTGNTLQPTGIARDGGVGVQEL